MPAQPSILLILNDDVGYSHIGCQGGEVRADAGLGVTGNLIAGG
jgi:arylsulfatase A-like enzyme